MDKPNRKVFFDVDYMGHSIKVLNKHNECSLVINNTVRDTYKSIIALNFTLKGTIEIENKDVEIVFMLKNSFPRAKLFLIANGQEIAAGKIFV